MAEQVLVLGVGNILFSDEAIGVRTVEHLQQCASLPGNVELMDGGTLGIRLMDAIMINGMKTSGKKRDNLGSIGKSFRRGCNSIAESATKKEGNQPSFFVGG